jgi:glucokinase
MKILRKAGFATQTHKGPGYAIGLLLNTASEIAVSLGIEKLKAIGISCGGPLDSRKGIVQSPPNLPGWDDIPIVDMFRDKFSVPVYLQNDANACALAEWKFGAGKGTRNMIFLTFGTGMEADLSSTAALYGSQRPCRGSGTC